MFIELLQLFWSNIGGWTAGDAATTLAKDTTTVKFDTRSLKITNGDATQAFARQTITTAAGEDYRFHGWFRSPATPNGASQLVDIDATAALGTTVTQAGATSANTWYEIDFTFEAADTSTTIDLGTGSVTDTEIGYWDQVQLLPNLVSNPGMEGTKQGSNPYYPAGSWTQEGSPGAGEVDVSANADHSGTSGVELINADDGEGITQDVTVASGKYYTFSAWAKNNSQDTEILLSGATTETVDTTNANVWTKYSYTFKAATTTLTIKLVSGAADQGGYFDDVAVIALDRDDPTTTGTATPSTTVQSYDTGKLEQGLWRDGTDTLTHPTSGNISSGCGTIALWVYMLPYDSYAENKYLFDIANVFRGYYNCSDYKFYFECYNGSNWTTIQAVSLTQSFDAGWRHIGCSWDITSGARISVDGATAVTDSGTWATQTLPANMYIGSSSSGLNQIDNVIDEFAVFDKYLTAVEMTNIYKEMGGI